MKKFNKKTNILKHSPVDEVFPSIAPSKNFIPDWYKKKNKYHDNINKIDTLPAKMTHKACASFADSFISGYIMPLAADIAVRQTEGGPSITWTSQTSHLVECRGIDTDPKVPAPLGCSEVQFAWQTQHNFKIPKGYSALVSHPFNRHDLPFVTLTGIIDGEMVVHKGNVPFYISSNFEGIIPAGTPIMQILLFKTENWDSELDTSILIEGLRNERRTSNVAFGWYKKTIWKKKFYN
jgi:hypothetical protein